MTEQSKVVPAVGVDTAARAAAGGDLPGGGDRRGLADPGGKVPAAGDAPAAGQTAEPPAQSAPRRPNSRPRRRLWTQ